MLHLAFRVRWNMVCAIAAGMPIFRAVFVQGRVFFARDTAYSLVYVLAQILRREFLKCRIDSFPIIVSGSERFWLANLQPLRPLVGGFFRNRA